MKHIVSSSFQVTCINICGNISSWMTYMQPCSTWIRKHIKNILFLRVSSAKWRIECLKCCVLLPIRLPFLFDILYIHTVRFKNVPLFITRGTMHDICKIVSTSYYLPPATLKMSWTIPLARNITSIPKPAWNKIVFHFLTLSSSPAAVSMRNPPYNANTSAISPRNPII